MKASAAENKKPPTQTATEAQNEKRPTGYPIGRNFPQMKKRWSDLPLTSSRHPDLLLLELLNCLEQLADVEGLPGQIPIKDNAR